METTQSVPYLNRLNTVEGTRQKPHLLYVTHGGKKDSYIFHYKEEKQFKAKVDSNFFEIQIF